MDKFSFLDLIHSNPGWSDLTKKGKSGINVLFHDVEFLVFRDAASQFLTASPQTECQVEIIDEFNALLDSCRPELEKDFDEWNMIRLFQDDNESDPIG